MKSKSVHLIGIGGIGLSSIARVLLAQDVRVSGSDMAPSPITESLSKDGVKVYIGHRSENLGPGVDLVVVTSAAAAGNPEVEAAKSRGIRVVKRRDFLGELTEGYRTIAISGSHGKTTTTALIGLMLADAGLDPVVVVGGIVPEFGGNTRTGKGSFFVIEADEYDYAFLGLRPYIGIVTNVDYDHPDLFASREDYQATFGEFASRVQSDGLLILCGDDKGALALAARSSAPSVTYGLSASDDWRGDDLKPRTDGGTDFRLLNSGMTVADMSIRLPGRHNVANAIGALAASNCVGVSIESARSTLKRFAGVGRRFQVRGEWNRITLVDDYAHHPSEIRATLAAARERFGERELWAVFQPHTFTRTRALLGGFATAFEAADHVIVTEIYAAREHDTLGMSGRDIVDIMKHRDARFIPTLEQAKNFVLDNVQPGGVLITLGAGDVNKLVTGLAETSDGDRPSS